MKLDSPTQGVAARRRLRPVLVWSGVTLLAALALALAMVVASLALQLGSDPGPAPTAPPPAPPCSSGRQRPPEGGVSCRSAQSTDEPTSNRDARRPPTQG